MILDNKPIIKLFDYLPKSGRKAGDGNGEGKYPYFTSGQVQSKFIDFFDYEGNCLVLGTGGKASIHFASNKFSATNDCFVLKPKDNKKVISKYVYYYLAGRIPLLERGFRGAGLKHLSRQYLNDLSIPLLSPDEQVRIVSILDEADTLRKKRTKSIKLLDDYLRSTFLEMFGDPVVNPKGWDKDLLKSKIAFLTSGSRGWAKYYSNQGTLFLRIQNIGRNKLILGDLSFVDAPDTQEANRTKALPRDLILTITADLGRTAIIPNNFEEAYINQHLALVRLKEINPYFISGYLSTDAGKSLINKSNKGGVKAGLNFNDIKSLPILMPPLKLQDKYEHIYHQVDKLKAKYKESEKELDNLFGSLSQKAFKGEL